nr:RebB family R body protein [uncultured Desulfobacter sp.]
MAPDKSLAVSYESLAHSLSLVMQNANSTQYEMKQIEAAAVARTCEKILSIIK